MIENMNELKMLILKKRKVEVNKVYLATKYRIHGIQQIANENGTTYDSKRFEPIQQVLVRKKSVRKKGDAYLDIETDQELAIDGINLHDEFILVERTIPLLTILGMEYSGVKMTSEEMYKELYEKIVASQRRGKQL